MLTKEEIKEILRDNENVLNKYKVKSIALFGSSVRNQQRKGSDIDLLVEFAEPTFDNYMGLLSELRKIFQHKVDLVNLKALKAQIRPFILKEAEWLRRG